MYKISRFKFMIALGAAGVLAVARVAAAQTVLMQDDFSDPGSGWHNQQTASAGEKGFGTYAGGQYQMTPLQDGSYGLVPAPRQTVAGNVRAESDLYLYASVGSGAGGLFCRAHGLEDFYAFLATGDGGLLIAKIRNGDPVALARGSVKSVLKGSVDTRITAECSGNRLRLMATDGTTLEARDDELTGGEAGLVVIGENAAGTSAVFDNFVLVDLGGGTAPTVRPPLATRPMPAQAPPASSASAQASQPAHGDTMPPASIAARVRALQPGQALIVVENEDEEFMGTALIGRDGEGMHLYDTTSEGGSAGTNLYINFSGDSFYSTIRRSTRYDSGVASWDVQIDAATGRGTCARVDLYPSRIGRLGVWSSEGRLVCTDD